jgi:hypothetical protein
VTDELLAQPVDHEVDDVLDLLVREVVEDDDLVHAVEELGPEELLELAGNALLEVLVRKPVARIGAEAETLALDDVAGADVARHDDDRVLEVDLAALGVGQATLLEDLQQAR